MRKLKKLKDLIEFKVRFIELIKGKIKQGGKKWL